MRQPITHRGARRALLAGLGVAAPAFVAAGCSDSPLMEAIMMPAYMQAGGNIVRSLNGESGEIVLQAADQSILVDTQAGVISISAVLPPAPTFPSGAIIFWDQSNQCPAGFTRATELEGRFLRIAADPGVTGGSDDHTHGVGTYTAAAHQHSLKRWDGSVPPVDDNSGGTDYGIVTDAAGGGTVGGTSGPADSRPAFVQLLACRAD